MKQPRWIAMGFYTILVPASMTPRRGLSEHFRATNRERLASAAEGLVGLLLDLEVEAELELREALLTLVDSEVTSRAKGEGEGRKG